MVLSYPTAAESLLEQVEDLPSLRILADVELEARAGTQTRALELRQTATWNVPSPSTESG